MPNEKFTIFALHKILYGDKNKKYEMGWTYGTYWGKDKCI